MPIIGKSPSFVAAMALIERYAPSELPVLVEGETGTGKEMAARALHYSSPRQGMPFVPINCGALPDSLVENELFGHQKGAYTDAKAAQRGLIALAERGTLFLDEVDTLSAKGQVLLLRFLQDRSYRPIGSDRLHTADVRIVAATNADLEELARQGRFRLDLYYRLKVLHVVLPPLRERVQDIPALAQHFLGACSVSMGRPQKMLNGESLQWLTEHRWPGNVRELESVIYRAYLLSDGDAIEIASIPEALGAPSLRYANTAETDFSKAKAKVIARFEVAYLADVMRRAQGNVTVAAKIAGTERRYLGKLLKKHRMSKSATDSAYALNSA
jgi:two-component system, NtrC family, response regulator GlrR